MRLVVIGGGAAGFFCAVTAARKDPELEVVIVEKTGKLLSKVRISGGGRCNVTHACFSIAEMIKKYPRGAHFVKKTFYQFFTEDTIAWFKERGVLLKAEQDGRMFPVSDSSETIINCLLREADKFRVGIRMHREVKDIARENGWWNIQYAGGEVEKADMICIACGGYPKDAMFEWLIRTGHSIQSPVPSLFTFNMPGNDITALTGISAPVKIRIQGTRLEEQGPALVTHWGLSGPAVLGLSARGARELAGMRYRFTTAINWSPETNEQQTRDKLQEMRSTHSLQNVIGRNGFGIPKRLWEYLCWLSGINDSIRWAALPSAAFNKLVRNISGQELEVEGKTTFKEEFVTAGGITLSEIDPQTMKSRLVEGLYFAGEIMDVDGITGGFNFQHAWTSGWIAGKSIAKISGKATGDTKRE
ncbi:MAG: NAD(P)/FAD-dependent oxidoreductase [Chitinophagaceae bacterium]|nr:NAD(P)/FAD-dependent oxidoreductase [Chitinophagaceae bacterium]